jgi:primosomal replication protein N
VTLANGFAYTPTLASVTPNTGVEAGGTAVTLTGTGFTDATGVTFGGSPGTSFSVVNVTTINVTTPAGTGTVDIVVQHAGGNATLPGGFTYLAAPTVTEVVPAIGPQTGGTAVEVRGTDFTGSTGVTFGGLAGTAFSVQNQTRINVTTPAGVGQVDVVVQHPGGDATLTNGFAYTPTIASTTPGTGAQAGGESVTITGTGFTDATEVLFGTTPAASFTVQNATTINATTPAGVGQVDVVVQHPGGDVTLTNAFAYTPTIASVNPTSGSEAGGDLVTITGTGFIDAQRVTFGGTDGTSVTVVNATTITVLTPAGTGLVDIVVIHPGGNATLPGGFTYTAP